MPFTNSVIYDKVFREYSEHAQSQHAFLPRVEVKTAVLLFLLNREPSVQKLSNNSERVKRIIHVMSIANFITKDLHPSAVAHAWTKVDHFTLKIKGGNTVKKKNSCTV